MSKIKRGFPHMGIIQDAIRELVPNILDGKLPPVPSRPLGGWWDYDPKNSVIGAQKLARKVTEIFQVEVKTITVNFCSLKGASGRIELDSTLDFFVEVDEELKNRPSDLVATLGHEVAHIFLREKKLEFSERLQNEILTDCATVFYGFGRMMAETYTISKTVTETYTMIHTKTEERKSGYLTPEELGYVQAKVGYMVLAEEKGVL